MNGQEPLPICRVGALDVPEDQPRWLVETDLVGAEGGA